jgi:hypothetical protein
MECEVVYEGLALRGWEGELETGAGINFLRERASRAMERLGGSSITRDFYYFLILNYFCC